jgi:hypothetical protein
MNTTRTFPDQADYLGPDEQVLRCVIAYNRHGGYCVPRSTTSFHPTAPWP